MENRTKTPKTTTPTPTDDRELCSRLLADDPDAWQAFLGQLEITARTFAIQRSDWWLLNELDEHLSETALALVKNGHRLLRKFDPALGSLTSFALGVFKCVWLNRRRQWKRRNDRETEHHRRAVQRASDPPLDDFMQTLTREERRFCLASLRGEGLSEYSETNRWQLASRIRRKAREYYSNEDDDVSEPRRRAKTTD